MKRKTTIAVLILTVILVFSVCLAGCGKKAQIKNGDFEKSGAAGYPPDAWDFNSYRGTSFVYCENDPARGGVVHIVADTIDDAAVYQTVSVEPSTLYRLSCWVRTEGVAGGAGANIALRDKIARSEALMGDNDWTLLTLYGRTGKSQKDITVSCRVGGFGEEAVGEAWFDGFNIEKVDKAEGEVLAFSKDTSEEDTSSGGLSPLSIILIVLAAAAVLIVGSAFLRRALNKNKKKSAEIPGLETYGSDKERNMPELKELRGRPMFSVKGDLNTEPTDTKLHLTLKDRIFVLALTLVYGVIAFIRLGTTSFPTNRYEANTGDEVRIEFGRSVKLKDVWQNPGICKTKFKLVTDNGEEILPYSEDYGAMYRWRSMKNVSSKAATTGVTLVVTGGDASRNKTADLIMLEMAFFDENGELIECTVPDSAKALFDEQDTVPERSSYYNGMYFDELYHGRTALEHIENLPVYEWTHPPLGKLIIAVGILIFGMNPFGWRIMGVIFGILMVPILYFMAKRLLKRPELALFSTFLFTFDFMHFTQTRIATVDVYAVFFILLMTYYMLKFMSMDIGDKPGKMLAALGLSGLFFGLGCATKWICVYTGAGLAAAFFVKLALMGRKSYALSKTKQGADKGYVSKFWKRCGLLCGFCVLFFIIIPVAIYAGSYYRYYTAQWKPSRQAEIYREHRSEYASADEVKLSFGEEIRTYAYRVVKMQKSMYDYHSQLKSMHSGSAAWWTWLLDLRPTWFYLGESEKVKLDTGESVQYAGTICVFGNPMVWIACNIATIVLAVIIIIGKKKFTTEAWFIFLFIGANLLPWVLVPRSTYAYHFFATVPYICLAAGYLMGYFEDAWQYKHHNKNAAKASAAKRKAGASNPIGYIKYAWMAVVAVLFAVFFPVLSGIRVRRSYISGLEWIPYHKWEYYETEDQAKAGKDPYKVDRIGWTFTGYDPGDLNQNQDKYVTKIVRKSK